MEGRSRNNHNSNVAPGKGEEAEGQGKAHLPSTQLLPRRLLDFWDCHGVPALSHSVNFFQARGLIRKAN